MQVDDHLSGDPNKNLWAEVINEARKDLRIKSKDEKWSSGRERQLNKKRAIWFFSNPHESSLSWICEEALNLDLQATVKKAHEICPEVKINLSIEKVECYHKGEAKKAAHGGF